MNKLVSRNPILRFKLGRKIHFIKPGDKMLYNGNEEVTEEILNGQTIYRRKNGSYIYSNNKLLSPYTTKLNFPNGSYFEEKDSSGNIIGRGRWQNGNKIYFDSPNQLIINEALEDRRSISKTRVNNKRQNNTLSHKKTIPSSIFAGHRIGKTGGLNYNISQTDIDLLIGTGLFTEKDFTNAKATLIALNKYFANSGLGSVAEDGAWGDLSRAALLMALNKSKGVTPLNNETTVVRNIPLVQLPTEKLFQTLLQKPLPLIQVPVQLPAYNRTGIREFLRNKGLNPYSFDGYLRKALRNVMNGIGTEEDKAIVKSMGILRLGGNLLPSRNIIERFKQKRNNY